MWFKQIINNFLPSLIKGAVSAGGGVGAMNLAPLLFPHCSTTLCDFIGLAAGLTIWGSSHGVGTGAGGPPPQTK